MKRLKRKILSSAGESLGETLAALLISCLALVMLAGAISSSFGIVVKSREKLDGYYSSGEESSGVVKRTSGGMPVENGIKITDQAGTITEQSFGITYYTNDEYTTTPVVAYELSD